jgi:heavy metal sensor kinase
MSRLPIRWRLTLWFGAILALLLFSFSLVLIAVMRHQLLATVDAELSEELEEITNEIRIARTVPEMLEQTKRRFLEHGEYHFQMLDSGGRVLFESRSFTGHPPLSAQLVTRSGTPSFKTRDLPRLGWCRVVSSVADGPTGRYVVHGATSMEPFEQQMSLLITVLVASGPVALVSGLAGGYTLARRALSPVDRIVDVANRITATDLHQRVDVLNPNDELGRLAQTLNALIDRLQNAIEELRRFTADAAHELRTPLAVLRSGIDVALRAPRSAEEYRQALEAASDEANRLTRLADQLLFLSRQAAGMMQIDHEEIRIDALVKDVGEQFAGRSEQAGVSLLVEPLEPMTVRGDDIRLSQVFYNVLENAIKYTPRGGRVAVRGRAVDHQIEIEVEDTGIGIPPDQLQFVFKRFYRVEQSRNGDRGGSGLGLSIAQSAVEAHGGTISIKSTPGRGTVVKIELPREEAGDMPRTLNSGQNQSIGESGQPSQAS